MLDKPAIEQERPAEPIAMPFAIPTWPIAIWPSMADAASVNSKVLQGLAILGGEWLDFVTRRLKEDASSVPPERSKSFAVDQSADHKSHRSNLPGAKKAGNGGQIT